MALKASYLTYPVQAARRYRLYDLSKEIIAYIGKLIAQIPTSDQWLHWFSVVPIAM